MWGLGLSSLRFVGTGVSGSGKNTNLLFAWKTLEASKSEMKVLGLEAGRVHLDQCLSHLMLHRSHDPLSHHLRPSLKPKP